MKEIEEISFEMGEEQVERQPNHGVSHVRNLKVYDDEKVYVIHGISGSMAEIYINKGTGRGMLAFELAAERGKLHIIPLCEVGLRPYKNGKWCNSTWLEDPSKRIKMNN